MLVPLPNLDDRRWGELVEEGRALIPVYDQTWSDHNIHDPGIMLVELLAWIAEMDIYWLNRIPDHHLRKFLALAGFAPEPPQPAVAALQILLVNGASPTALPAGTVFEGRDAQGQMVPFQTLHPVTLAPGNLVAILSRIDQTWVDLTGRLQRGESLAPFGADPAPEAAFYLGFTHPLPIDEPVSLGFTLAGPLANPEERQRLVEWQHDAPDRCEAPATLVQCHPDEMNTGGAQCDKPLRHHDVGLTWEYLDATGKWQTLESDDGRVWDDTRELSLTGRIVVRVPGKMAYQTLGEPERRLYWIRCRFERGTYDAAPSIQNLSFNSVFIEQRVNPGTQTWTIAADAEVMSLPPEPGESTGLGDLQFSSTGSITKLAFTAGAPGFRLISYQPPDSGQAGQLSIEAELLDRGNGKPCQVRTIALAPVHAASLKVFTYEEGRWIAWEAVADFDAATASDPWFVLDPTTGELTFGDDLHGRALPAGALPLASYETTRAEAGNLPANAVTSLPDSPTNRMVIGDPAPVIGAIASIRNPQPAFGGRAAEDTGDATARLLTHFDQPQRAVTLDDVRELALRTPGVQLARVAVIANVHPAYPCMKAPGIITAVVLPHLPAGRPVPGQGLLAAVRAYLAPRRIVGTRIIVMGPCYTHVAVQAQVHASAGVDPIALRDRITSALDRFFDPLQGGPESDGWPLGRDVYRTEVLQVIDEVEGVDHVLSLEMVDASGVPHCGNVCLGPLCLVEAGEHRIEVH